MTWLGLDGEGIGRTPHRYVMLCAANSSRSWCDYIEDVNGLSTVSALTWMLTLPATRVHKGAESRVAGYYLSYDWTKVLADLPHSSIYRLLRPELRARGRDEGGGFSPVHFKGFKLNYLSGMMRIAKGERSLTIWDVGKYYQNRFVAALEQAGFAPPELIERMKSERGSWDESDLDRMREYCLEECVYLAKLVELLERQHLALGLEPTTWHGPGSTASALLTKHNVAACVAPVISEVQDRAERAFFGGRFEQGLIGQRSGVHSFDVRSAYPHAASTLPCLKHGKWVHRRRAPKDGAVALVRYKVTDIGDRAWGPLPCRLDDGSIVWPRGGSSGWCWSVEWEAAVRGWRGIDYGREHWELVTRCDCRPFSFIPELFEWRMLHPENKQVGKLSINSVYGKLAQSIGGGSKWSSRVWAGIITATTRARMLDLITSHGNEGLLCAIATDGAYSQERLPIESPGLGGWETEGKGLMTFVRPGIYWSHDDILEWYSDESSKTLAEAAAKAVRSRGISRRHLLHQLVKAEQAIVDGDERALLGTTQQFGGARECVYRTQKGKYRRSALYGEWYDSPATLSLRPQPKRDADWRPPLLEGIESAPYKPGGGVDAKKLRLIGSMLEGRIR